MNCPKAQYQHILQFLNFYRLFPTHSPSFPQAASGFPQSDRKFSTGQPDEGKVWGIPVEYQVSWRGGGNRRSFY
jgi:hypothetical protein